MPAPELPPKRGGRPRRRRRQDKPAIAARLVLDDHVRGDVGILSEDLFADLFPHLRWQKEDGKKTKKNEGFSLVTSLSASDPSDPHVLYVAIAPWMPNAVVDTIDWTVVPVARSAALAHSTVQFSPASLALQKFAATLQQVAPSKLSGHSRGGIEILALDVAAVALETVFVNLEGDLAQRLENGEGTFFREHPGPAKKGGGGTGTENCLTTALRVALGSLPVVHAGDLFPLPLPPHPITHVPPNPGKVAFCEPVAQGVLAPHTRIIVSRGRLPLSSSKQQAPIPRSRKLNGGGGGTGSSNGGGSGGDGGSGDDDGEDTANDQFFSAAEERNYTETDALPGDSEADSDLSSAEDGNGGGGGGGGHNSDSDSLSDDSMDDMISLQAPTLPATLASGVSTLQAGSPMTLVGGLGGGSYRGRKTNGVATPGSVFSSFTATTARPDRPRGRLFKAQGLAGPIPAELLHPKPGDADDEEARVYVDVNSLTRIGCFSGDWVRLEAAEEPPENGFGPFSLGGFGGMGGGEDDADWRPVRVFGLPEGYVQRPVTRIPSSKHEGGRRLSFFESQIQRPSSPVAYVSPILLANIHMPGPASTPYVRLAPLKGPTTLRHGRPSTKLPSTAQPPLAQKVILQQVRTPVAIEKSVQTAVVAGLKWHFEQKLRVVKAGDLIAVPIDAQLGRTMNGLLQASESAAFGYIIGLGGGGAGAGAGGATRGGSSGGRRQRTDEVAWFKISHVQPQSLSSQHRDRLRGESATAGADDESIWGPAVACVDISTAHLEQSGTVTLRIPGLKDSNWPYYLGLRQAPRRAGDNKTAAAVVDPDRSHVSPLRRQLRDLVAAATSRRAMELQMPPVAVLLVSTQRSIGKATVAAAACADVGLHTYVVDAFDVVNEASAGGRDAKTEGVLKARAALAMSCGPECCALLIRHMEALTADRMVASFQEILADARVVVATTTEPDKLPDGVRSLFTHELEMRAPDETERADILRSIVSDRAIPLDPEVDLAHVALKTAALVAGDLVDVVERALVCRQTRLEEMVAGRGAAAATATTAATQLTLRDVQVAGGAAVRGLTRADFEAAVDAARKNFADAIGAPKIPNVTWNDVGGLDNVKDVVMETIQLPLERPELFAKGMKKRSGILFYGPPGTGKTLLAKAIATEYSLNFFSVKGPELLNMYIGESEANVRRVFQRARDARPCVVFFDELDSVAPKRGNQGDSGGVMDRIVSQLLAELDGMSGEGEEEEEEGSEGGHGGGGGGGGVFVVGATNRPDLLDPALLRPGRFDTMLYLGVSDTHDKQLRILEALTRKFTLHPSVSLRAVAERLPFTYTGADFYALCSDAMLKAVTRQAERVDAKVAALNGTSNGGGNGKGTAPRHVTTAYFFDHYATPADVAVEVTEQDFIDAQRELVPSISAGELAHYERVRATFEGTPKEKSPSQPEPETAPRPRKGKGKGKAVATAPFSDVEEEEDEIGAEYGGGYGPAEDADVSGLGDDFLPHGRAKGKGKAVAGFHDQGASDDEELYN